MFLLGSRSHLVLDKRENPEKAFLRTEFEDTIRKSFLKLSEREKMIIMRRFGIGESVSENTDYTETLENLGHELNIHRERVRQIEGTAIRKLGKRATRLRAFTRNGI